ncbi:MAG: PorT family protein [Cytophagaceae bacterium]|nr:PorT family protein [Cytophagaceae bacterium]
MSKKQFLVAAALLISFSLHAQRARNLSFGPLIGVNVSNLYGDVTNNSSKVGLVAGGFFNYSIKQTFGVSGQLLYSQLGANFNNGDKVKLNYLQIPLFATFYFGRGLQPGAIRPKLFVGPYVGFLLDAKDKNGNTIKDGANAFYNPLDVGLNLGGGLNYALRNQSWINLDVRYGVGLLDVANPANVNRRNGAFTALLGISFPLGNYDDRTRRIKP